MKFTIWQVSLTYLTYMSGHFCDSGKGQIKPKADWHVLDSPKKQTNELGFFAFHGKKTKFVSSFFGRIQGAPVCFRFYLTFSIVY